jgi:hypothetical protein
VVSKSVDRRGQLKKFSSTAQTLNLVEIAAENFGSIPICKRIILGVSMRVSVIFRLQKDVLLQSVGVRM